MESLARPVLLAHLVTKAKLAPTERRVRPENAVHKDNRVQLVWLDCQLRKEKEERVDLVENQVQLEKKGPEEFQESPEHKVSKVLKDQLVAQDPKEAMESQDLKEVLADQEPQEIREPKVELDQLASVDKKEREPWGGRAGLYHVLLC